MNEILAACISNVSYALADNINGLVSRKNNPLQVAFWASVSGSILYFIPALYFITKNIQLLSWSHIVTMLVINILVNIGYLSFLMGMNKGSVTLTGVIGGAFPAVTTLAAFLFFREHITEVQFLFILFIFLGIILSSLSGKIGDLLKEAKTSGILFAFGAMLFGGYILHWCVSLLVR